MKGALLFLVVSWSALAADEELPQGYTPSEEASHELIHVSGYIDVGFARAGGDGTSFSPFDARLPLDYGSDAFAPAVNSRGDVASTETSNRFTNGFLPRSMGIQGNPSFMLNTASVDVRITPLSAPVMFFSRLQLMPRFAPTGDASRVDLQQAFGRISPFKTHEFAISIGRFDSVFGIEYLENEANLRTGITPSLIARYTTGQGLGVKALYRLQLPSLWSAVSLNVSATNHGTRTDALVPVDASLTGAPVGSARLGYELNLQRVQAKLGVSAMYGPRNDSTTQNALQKALAADLRVQAYGISLAGEFLRLTDDKGWWKYTGQSQAELASGFGVWGGWGRLSVALPFTNEALTQVVVYGRYDRRQGHFDGASVVVTDRLTVGAELGLWDLVLLKAEYLFNREISGTPNVDNDVFTTSVVFSW